MIFILAAAFVIGFMFGFALHALMSSQDIEELLEEIKRLEGKT